MVLAARPALQAAHPRAPHAPAWRDVSTTALCLGCISPTHSGDTSALAAHSMPAAHWQAVAYAADANLPHKAASW